MASEQDSQLNDRGRSQILTRVKIRINVSTPLTHASHSTFTTHPMNCISVTDLKENYMLVCLYICLCAFAFIGLSLWNRLPPLPRSLHQADGIPLQRHSQCEMSHTSQYQNIYLTLSVQQYTDSSQHMELVIVSLNVYKAPPQGKDNFAKRVAIMRM